MKYLSLAGLWLLTSLSAHAITLDALQQRFASQPVIRAHFEQTRQIKTIPQPLRSQGEMIIARHDGLLWQQTSPFPMTMLLDDSRMVQVMPGQTPQIITAQSNPQMFQFNYLLRALFQADQQVLKENFRLDFTALPQDRWRLQLTPLTSPLDKLFTRIDLQGQHYLEQIALHDKQGDDTQIVFSQHQLTPDTLTDEERQRFHF